MSDAFDPDLHGRDLAAEGRRTVLMGRIGSPGPGFDGARDRLALQLSGAEFDTVDEATGVFEITLEAADAEAAVRRVFDAIAAAGADDHVVIAEHAKGQPPPTA